MLRAGMQRAAEIVYKRSQVYVPVDTTALKKSGRVVADRAGPFAQTYSVIYGGVGVVGPVAGTVNPTNVNMDVDYAWYVHENLHVHHAYPTQAKYLERAVYETIPEQQEAIRNLARDIWFDIRGF